MNDHGIVHRMEVASYETNDMPQIYVDKFFTPLDEACIRGYDQSVQMLVEHGASMEASNNDLFTPLW